MSSFPLKAGTNHRSHWGKRQTRRRLFFEPLEERRVLASISLSTEGGIAGSLDAQFSGDGRDLAILAGLQTGWDVAVDGDGKIVVVGSTDNGSNLDFAIARFNADGALDTCFAASGLFTTTFPGEVGNAEAISVAIQPDGGIVVAGYAFTATGSDFALLRLTNSGALDTSFSGGQVITDLALSDQARDVVIQPDGKIVAVGYAQSLSALALARYDSLGALDTTFSLDGKIVADQGFIDETLEAVAIQPDGSIVAAGTVVGSEPSVALIRVDEFGTFDTSFDADGVVIDDIDGSNVWEEIQGLALQGTSIVVVGSDFINSDLLLARYDSAGTRDTTFDMDGFVLANNGGNEFGFDVAVTNDNKLLVAGSTDAAGNDFLVVRYEANGAPDSSFGTAGIATADFANANDLAHAVDLQTDGKIVVAGTSAGDFAVARFLPVGVGAPPEITGVEGDSYNLTGTFDDLLVGSTHSILIHWGDGQSTIVSAGQISGSSFSVNHVFADDSSSVMASIVETANHANVIVSDLAAATIGNADPSVDPITGSGSVRWQTLSFAGAFSDVGFLDTHEVAWDFGDGTQIGWHSSTDAGALSPTHAYAAAGTYTVNFLVRDDDGGLATGTKSITIAIIELQEDPSDPSKTALVLGGTGTSDSIEIRPNGAALEAFIGGISQGVFAPTGGVIVYGGVGNDDLQVAGSINRTAWLYGGDGDDRVKGGGGNDVLFGGEGADLLVGGQGRDLLIGGLGADRIVGNADDDVLISGTTAHDGDPTALAHILAEWTSTRSYLHRVANLYGGFGCDGENGSFYLNQNTVHDDDAADLLTGSTGQDLFFGNFSLDDDATVKDKITDLHASEFAIDIDFIESE